MKNLSIVLIAGLLLCGCGKNELSREDALALIKKEKGYPRVFEYEIFYSDPYHATRLLEKGLEGKGLVTIKKTQKLKDIGSPLVHFTAKAEPYLINGTPEEWNADFAAGIQRVKLADEDIGEITAIIADKSNNTATVEYTTVYKNITPFAVLLKRDLQKPQQQVAYFALSDKGWVRQKRSKR